MELLQIGDSGPEVAALQEFLISQGYDLGPMGADGEFGRRTRAAVMEFQRANGLDVDGIVGDDTRGAMGQGGEEAETPIPRPRPDREAATAPEGESGLGQAMISAAGPFDPRAATAAQPSIEAPAMAAPQSAGAPIPLNPPRRYGERAPVTPVERYPIETIVAPEEDRRKEFVGWGRPHEWEQNPADVNAGQWGPTPIVVRDHLDPPPLKQVEGIESFMADPTAAWGGAPSILAPAMLAGLGMPEVPNMAVLPTGDRARMLVERRRRGGLGDVMAQVGGG
jgi:peptidoglycan hydrolase-like protein with peptidoglycan-binding domain